MRIDIEKEKLFVYGIFLDEHNRDSYGMSSPRYATVRDFLTVGGGIVQAVYVPDAGLSLTGLLVDMNPEYWRDLDALEHGYERILVRVGGEYAWMYAALGTARKMKEERDRKNETDSRADTSVKNE